MIKKLLKALKQNDNMLKRQLIDLLCFQRNCGPTVIVCAPVETVIKNIDINLMEMFLYILYCTCNGLSFNSSLTN